jgi:hypothetical protein
LALNLNMTTREQMLLKPYMRMTGSVQYEKRTGAAKAVEKTLRGKVQKQTFPLSTQPRLLLALFASWTRWLRPKPAGMAPFITGADSFEACRVKLAVSKAIR